MKNPLLFFNIVTSSLDACACAPTLHLHIDDGGRKSCGWLQSHDAPPPSCHHLYQTSFPREPLWGHWIGKNHPVRGLACMVGAQCTRTAVLWFFTLSYVPWEGAHCRSAATPLSWTICEALTGLQASSGSQAGCSIMHRSQQVPWACIMFNYRAFMIPNNREH